MEAERVEFLGGFAHEKGFRILVGRGGRVVVHLGEGGPKVASPVPPPPRLPLEALEIAASLVPWGRWPRGLAWLLMANLAVVGVLGLTATGPRTSLGVVMGFLLMALFLRITPLPRWHALEHKTAHLLERGLPRGLEPAVHLGEGGPKEELVRLLQEAPSYHPRCGTLMAGTWVGLTALLTLAMPLTLALVLALLLTEDLARLGWDAWPLPLEGLFLAPPRPEEVEAVGRGLAELLREGA